MRKSNLCALAGLASLSWCVGAQAAVVFSDSFESGLGAWTANTAATQGTYSWGTSTTTTDPVVAHSTGQVWFDQKFSGTPAYTYQMFHSLPGGAGAGQVNPAATSLKFTAEVYSAALSVRSYGGFSNVSGTSIGTSGATLARIGFPSATGYRGEYWTTALQTTATSAAVTNAWHTVTVTYDLANKQVGFTFDGSPVGSSPFANANITAMPNAVTLGYNAGSSNNVYWDNVKVEQFAPAAAKPTNPGPANGSTTVGINDDLSWTPGANNSFFDVFFDINPTPTTQVVTNGTLATFDPGTLLPNMTYYWRVDAKNVLGDVTTGDVWSFTTTPEPTTLVFLGLGGLILGRKRSARA